MTVKEYMIATALNTAADNRYGYSNAWPQNRFDDDTPYDGDCGAFCSFCLNEALKQIGINSGEYYEPQGGWNIYNEAYLLKYCDRYGYEDTRNEPGDILINGGHTVMITSTDPDKITHASNDYDGMSGDSSGQEIRTQNLYDGGWHYIYRLKDEYNREIGSPDTEKTHIKDTEGIMNELEILKLGSTGNQVKNLQGLLNVWMTSGEPLVVDGIFGKYTETRLKHYQYIQDLKADGVCGRDTWEDLLLN